MMRSHIFLLFAGFGIGAAAMFLSDPARGRRRRALVRDQLMHAAHKTDAAVARVSSDARNRVHGGRLELQARFRHEAVPDDILAARVRARIGRAVSHPRALEIEAHDGRIRLSGDVFRAEVPRLLGTVWMVRGVRHVEHALREHDRDSIATVLQGRGPAVYFGRQQWSPAMRALGALAGGSLVILGGRRRGAIGMGLGAIGVGTLVRSAGNRPLNKLAN
jgi:hypothetical protein